MQSNAVPSSAIVSDKRTILTTQPRTFSYWSKFYNTVLTVIPKYILKTYTYVVISRVRDVSIIKMYRLHSWRPVDVN